MTIEEMKNRKRELGYSYRQIADLSGLPLSTVQKVLGGITEAPRRDTILALEKVLAGPGARETEYRYDSALLNRLGYSEYSVQEGIAEYQVRSGKKQGEYTLEDYYALPDGERCELIDGVIYDMTAPLYVHQMIAGRLYMMMSNLVEKLGVSCVPFIAPADVQLNMDNRTMVQPDVFMLCDLDKLKRRVTYGAPEFIVEVLSPSTKHKDMFKKLEKYSGAGVLEYWIADPEKKTVLVYDFAHDNQVTIYSFRDTIPLGVSEGTASIDFSKIDDYLQPFLERFRQEEDEA